MVVMKNVIFGVVLLLMGCDDVKPKYVLDKEKMVPILVGFYLASEEVRMSKLSADSSSIYFKSVYKRRILKENEVDVALFDSSYKYYLRHPNDFMEIQAEVTDSIKVMHLLGDLDF